MKRVLKRDFNERGKGKIQAKNDFLKSWEIYYSKSKNQSLKNNKNELTITKSTNIESIIKKLYN